MHRRQLIKTLPVTAAAVSTAVNAKAAESLEKTGASLKHGGVNRIAGLSAWSSVRGVKPAIRTSVMARGTTLLSLVVQSRGTLPSDASLGIRFEDAPDFRQGVGFWRYAPWKAWTKPVQMMRFDDLEADDVQCAYWKYADGTYAVALPLGGGGFRTTLGARAGAMTTVSKALAAARVKETLPQVAIGFGEDLYSVLESVFEDAMVALGTPENLRKHKSLPQALTYLGWNTWNASENGRVMSEQWVLDQVDRLLAAKAPIRSLVVDDGYFEADDGRLQSLVPNRKKFPNGLKPVVDALKARGMKHVGVWHAFNIYWNGMDPESEIGKLYAGKLFSWTQKPSPIDTTGRLVTYHSLKPEAAVLNGYFDTYYTKLKEAGISIVKVDNQLVAERMAKDNYPVWDLAVAYHSAINRAVGKHFDNAIINCMDMTNDAFLNFGRTPVARSVEDYFPYKIGETYNLQEGNAAAHVLQAIYNALYFGQVSFPDFDMFETSNPNARLHAVARAANCAPIYVTDKAGQHDVELLHSLVDHEGLTLRADTPLLPTRDCLFQVQAAKLFKAWSLCGEGGLLTLMNLADAPRVSGKAYLTDIARLPPGRYAVWAQFEESLCMADDEASFEVTLPRFGHEILRAAPIRHGRAVLGLKEKLNGLASVRDTVSAPEQLDLMARDHGVLLIYCEQAPSLVLVDEKPVKADFANQLLRIELKDGSRAYKVSVR